MIKPDQLVGYNPVFKSESVDDWGRSKMEEQYKLLISLNLKWRKFVTRALFFIAITFIVSSCFTSFRLMSLDYPVTLIIKNQSVEIVDLTEIYSSAEVQGYFYINGDLIPPNGTSLLTITEQMYFEMRDGFFEMRGACGQNKEWGVEGMDLERNFVHNEKEWSVTIFIKGCDTQKL